MSGSMAHLKGFMSDPVPAWLKRLRRTLAFKITEMVEVNLKLEQEIWRKNAAINILEKQNREMRKLIESHGIAHRGDLFESDQK